MKRDKVKAPIIMMTKNCFFKLNGNQTEATYPAYSRYGIASTWPITVKEKVVNNYRGRAMGRGAQHE